MTELKMMIIPYSEIESLEPIGGGGFGVVYKARYKNQDVAYKKQLRISMNIKENNSFISEAHIQMKLSHRNILGLLGIVSEDGHYGFVLEYMEHGSMKDYFHNYESRAGRKIPWKRKLRMLHDVALGMQYLHEREKPIIHGDLKYQNVLLGDHLRAKISDFGFSTTKLVSKSHTNTTQPLGTITHVPPEYHKDHRIQKKESFDIYSFAILMWETFTEEKPFGDTEDRVLIVKLEKPECRPDTEDENLTEISKKVKDLMQECWQHSPENRPHFSVIEARIFEELLLLFKENQSNLNKDLSNYLYVENGLADHMLAKELITHRQHEEIIKTPLHYGKCDKLISAIQQNEKSITVIHNEFLDVLLAMKQDHIINYLLQNDPESQGDNRVLTASELRSINKHIEQLKGFISMEKNKLLDHLVGESVISDFQKNITNMSQDWVNELISIMRRKSFANFKKFVSCLHQTGLIAPFNIKEIGTVDILLNSFKRIEEGKYPANAIENPILNRHTDKMTVNKRFTSVVGADNGRSIKRRNSVHENEEEYEEMSLIPDKCIFLGCQNMMSRYTHPYCYDHVESVQHSAIEAQHSKIPKLLNNQPQIEHTNEATIKETSSVTFDIDKQFVETMKGLEARTKISAANCKRPGCTNFGNRRCQGYCHGCFQTISG